MNEFSTPLMRQYNAIKERHPHALLFFRLGDFYELFFEDAVVAAKELQITLTSRNREKGVAVPMCGVPYHAAEGYIAKLIRKGFRVAVCDQVEDPRLAKKLVKREVTRVVTPGTAIESQVLEPRENNFLAGVVEREGGIGLAFADLSTGEYRATEFTGAESRSRLIEELGRIRPRELLLPSPGANPGPPLPDPPSPWTETRLDDWVFSEEYGARFLREHFRVTSLAGYGMDGHPLAIGAAAAILHYVRETQRGSVGHHDGIRFYQQQEFLMLDPTTVRNLELLEPLWEGSRDSTLVGVLDQCVTSMGARKLKSWILRPSINRVEIEARWDSVEELLKNTIGREEMCRLLGSIQDLERLLSKVTLETANARDLLALKQSLRQVPLLRAGLAAFQAGRLRELHQSLDELGDVHDLIEKSIHPDPPATLTDGGLIRAGFHAELDELRDLSQNSKRLVAQIEVRERERTRIASLKVRFNNIFGYYIEISKSNLHLAPADYERKQTLVNAERFTTPELKELESKILEAEEKMLAIERDLFEQLRVYTSSHAARIKTTAQAVAELDVSAALASVAAESRFVRPRFGDSGEFKVIAGRHPVIEKLAEKDAQRFIPNDLYFHPETEFIAVITGPNMGGKSTYLRQAALLVILAQMGSFVPAESALLPIVDRVFTRIGAADNLARGRSTFMVEMTETAVILNTATARSLIVLDEIGRGTATYDGLALAWAVVEHIHRHIRAKTLSATHYHELTELAAQLPGVRNLHVSVKESGDQILFLRRVEPGAADKSYGIEVARLAALPMSVIERARQILKVHESAVTEEV